jgi:beta-N-acetylhexosaminidase
VRVVALAAAALLVVTAGCSVGPGAPDRTGGTVGGTADAGDAGDAQEGSVDPDRPSGWGPTAVELTQARRDVAAMSVRAQAAQVLMPGFWGLSATGVPPAVAARNQQMHGVGSPAQALERYAYGGVFVNSQSLVEPGQVRGLLDGLHEVGDRPDGLPLLASIDQEGGDVQRLREGMTDLPSAATIGAAGSPALARRLAEVNGTELRALGFTMVMAPVADVDTADNPVIGSRSFGTGYRETADLVTASVKGFLDAGIVPAVKHFPGHGSVGADSHRALPVQRKGLDRLRDEDLVPFEAAVAAGAPVVMVGHIAVPELEDGMPASLSRPVVSGLLREELGFQGVAVTDSQGMGPVNGPYNSREGAVRSLLAGNDLVLNSPRPLRALRAVVEAVRSGRLPAQRLASAATRVLALRAYQARIGAERPPMSVLRRPEHLAAANRAFGGG